MNVQSMLARLPRFLSGPAGAVIGPVERVAHAAAANRTAYEGLLDGSMSTQRALDVADSRTWSAAWTGIEGALDDLVTALGQRRASKVMNFTDDSLSFQDTPLTKVLVAERLAEEAKLVVTEARSLRAHVARVEADAAVEVGSRSARRLQEFMLDDVLPELERTAARTAGTRLVVGGGGAALATAGVVALTRDETTPTRPLPPAIKATPFAPFPRQAFVAPPRIAST